MSWRQSPTPLRILYVFALLGSTVAGSKCHSKGCWSWNYTCVASQACARLCVCVYQKLPQVMRNQAVMLTNLHLSNYNPLLTGSFRDDILYYSPDNIIWLFFSCGFICKVAWRWWRGKVSLQKADTSSGSWLLTYAWEVNHWNEGRLVGDWWRGWWGGKWWDEEERNSKAQGRKQEVQQQLISLTTRLVQHLVMKTAQLGNNILSILSNMAERFWFSPGGYSEGSTLRYIAEVEEETKSLFKSNQREI